MSLEVNETVPVRRKGFSAFFHVVAYFLPSLYPVWDKILLKFLIGNCMTFLGVSGAMVAGKVVDEGLAPLDMDRFMFWIGLGGLISLIVASLGLCNTIIGAYINAVLEARFRFSVFDHLQKHSLRFFQSRPVGEHMYRTNDDTMMTVQFVGVAFLQLLERLQTVTIALGVIFTVNVSVGLIVLVYMVFYAPVSHIAASFVRNMHFTSRWRIQRSFATLQENLAGYPVDKMFATERRNLRTYYAILSDATRYAIRYMNFSSILNHFISGIGGNLLRSVFLHVSGVMFFGYLVMSDRLSTGEYIFMGGVLVTLIGPFEELIASVAGMRIWAVPAERMLETLEVKPEIENVPAPKRITAPQGVVEFENVSFRYGPGMPDVVKGLSFRATPGTMTAFVGLSGAGKTSVFNLLMRFYDPTGGCVRIDGEDLRAYDLKSYRDHVGLVLQESYLFSATLRDNILVGNPHATEEAVTAALRRVDMEEFVRRLPYGLDAVMSEAGNVSVGDRQRISIARALLRDPQFLYLDEPTASLDPETTREIARHLDVVMAGRTSIVIAHSLQLITGADQIIVMDKGVAIQRGKHADLLEQPGFYREMWYAELEKNRRDVQARGN